MKLTSLLTFAVELIEFAITMTPRFSFNFIVSWTKFTSGIMMYSVTRNGIYIYQGESNNNFLVKYYNAPQVSASFI